MNDVEEAKETREYGLDMESHPNWFDASYISWLSYDSLNVELPDGFLVADVYRLLEMEMKEFCKEADVKVWLER